MASRTIEMDSKISSGGSLATKPIVFITITATICLISIMALIGFYVKNRKNLHKNFKSINFQ